MCISISSEPPYRCCCCIPIIVGVILVFFFNLLSLSTSISIRDWFGVAIYGTLSACFLISFVKPSNLYVRRFLYHSYLVGFLLTLAFFIWLMVRGADKALDELCSGVSRDWWDSQDCFDILSPLWTLWLVLYFVFVIIVQLFCVRLLKYYAKELELHLDSQMYQKLDDDQSAATTTVNNSAITPND